MTLKHFKNMFIAVIIFLIIAGIYIIYIKDNKNGSNVQAKNKETRTTKEISIGITEFDTINPILTKSLEIQHITKLIYEPLINITQDFNAEPGIAEEWSKLDELTYIVKLDENKKWQDGEDVRVEDIEFTIKSINESDSIYKENIEKIERIEKINETTFKIYLKEEVNFFEYMLCFPIVQEKTYNREMPIGTGDYKIQSLQDSEIVLKGIETTLTIKVYNSITELYNSFTREEVDLIITQNTNYEEHIGNIGFEETIIPGREFYYISCENIEDIEERQNINKGINKEKLVYDLYNQKYIIADFPLEYGSYLNKEKIIENPVNLEKGGTYTLSVEKANYEIAEVIKEQLEEKGTKILIQRYKNSRADLILKKQTVPITPIIQQYFKDGALKNEIKEIAKIENKEILKEEYGEIIDKYYEELPFISLYFNSYIILRTDNLKGDFSGNWYNVFYNIDTWYKVM